MSRTITPNGRVTLPKWVREALDVGPGDAIDFRLNDRGEQVVEKAPGADAREESPNRRTAPGGAR